MKQLVLGIFFIIFLPIGLEAALFKRINAPLQITSLSIPKSRSLNKRPILMPKISKLSDCEITAPLKIKLAINATKLSCKYQRWLQQMSWEETHHTCVDSKISSAKGCVQFLNSTWNEICRPRGWSNVRNAFDNFACAGYLISTNESNLYNHWLRWWPKEKRANFRY